MRKAVLIIHGFAGGTYDEEALANYLELNRFDVYQFTLPGHDKPIFNKVKKEDWINSCEEHMEMLINNGYKKIYVVGHSMGGVLACYIASKYKEVKRLALAAPAFKYMTFGEKEFRLGHAIIHSKELFEDYSKATIISRAVMFPITVVKEFMSLIEKLQDTPSKIECPIIIFQGTKDKVVPISSSEYVYNNVLSKTKELVILDGVTHDIFRSNETDNVDRKIKEFFNKIIW